MNYLSMYPTFGKVGFITEDRDYDGSFIDALYVDFDAKMYTSRGLTENEVIVPNGFNDDLVNILEKYGFVWEEEY